MSEALSLRTPTPTPPRKGEGTRPVVTANHDALDSRSAMGADAAALPSPPCGEGPGVGVAGREAQP
jgi:hypothetical protein